MTSGGACAVPGIGVWSVALAGTIFRRRCLLKPELQLGFFGKQGTSSATVPRYVLTFVFEVLAQLHDELPGVTRNDGAVILEDHPLQLQGPFPLVLGRSRPQRALLPGIVEREYVEAERLPAHLLHEHQV